MRYLKITALLGMSILAMSGLTAQEIEYVSSILWNQVNEITVMDDIAYCAFDNGLQIIDFTDPHNPVELSRMYLPGQTTRVKIAGHYAFVASVDEGLQIIDIADPAEPELIFTLTETDYILDLEIANDLAYIMDGSKGFYIYHILNPYDPAMVYNERLSARDICIANNMLFLAGFNRGFEIYSLDDPQDPELLSSVDLNGMAENIAVQGNYAYVGIGANSSLFVYDISNPEAPTYCSSFPAFAWNFSLSGEIGCMACMSQELKVINISDPYNIEEKANFPVEGYCEVVTVSGTTAYAGNNWENLEAVDLTVPSEPVELGRVEMHDRNFAFKVAGNLLYAGQFNAVDITDRQNPQILGSLDIPINFTRLDNYGNHVLLGGNDSSLYIVDASDTDNPTLAATYDYGSRVQDIRVHDSYAFIAGSEPGVQILDLTDPENPTYVTTFALNDAYVSDIYFQDDYMYLAHQNEGLVIADISDPANPVFVSNLVLSNSCQRVYVRDNLAYLASGNAYYIVDISDMLNPEQITVWGSQGSAYDICGDGHYVYMANTDVWVIDISDLPNCYEVDRYITPGWTNQIYVDSNYIYVADRSSFMIFRFNPTGIDDDISGLPAGFSLGQNYPNPFNARTEIQFDLKSEANVRLKVYDILGRHIGTLLDSNRPAGSYNIIWDAADLPSGIYFYKLQAGDITESRKCLLLK